MQNMKDIAMLLAINHMTGSHSEACASQMNATDLSALKDSYMKEYESYQCKNLKLDMSRGKPGPDQLILSAPMLDVLSSQSALSALDGTDCRNYGCLDGIPEAKELMGSLLGLPGRKHDRRRQLQLEYDVRHHCPGNAPRCLRIAFSVVPFGKGEISLSCSRLRPPFCHLSAFRHRDDLRSHEPGWSGHGFGRKTGQ